MTIAAILGGAITGPDELARLRTMCNVDAVFGVNDAGAAYPGELAALVTLHAENIDHWLSIRAAVDKLHKPDIICNEDHPRITRVVDYRWPGMNASGSSGLFAVKVALESHDLAVLCGVPMDGSVAHCPQTTQRKSTIHLDIDSFWDAWEIALPFIRDRVRSMSGRTAQLLGMPTREFLQITG